MLEATTGEQTSADPKRPTYVPIPVAALRSDTVTGFDVYIEVEPGQPPVLYCERHLAFTEGHRRRLQESGVQRLFIQRAANAAFRQYLEQQLPVILADPDVSLTHKSRALYRSAEGVVREVFQDPKDPEVLRRGACLVEATLSFLFASPESLRYILQTTSRDYETYLHSVNVCIYGLALAQQTGLEDTELLRALGQGLLFHDVGKALIDPSIINCRADLTVAQWDILRQHPVFGHEALSETKEVGVLALDVIRHHHEKLNGTGYPDGLRESHIQPIVRIATLADVFDALTTTKTYRKAYTSFQALKIMTNQMAGELDDPLLRTFIETMAARRPS